MNRILKLAFFLLTIPTVALTQEQLPGIRMVPSIDPVFPTEAKNQIYGESIRVAVTFDEKGVVKGARAFGPLAPCSNLTDPVVNQIQEAAIAAAKKFVFEPAPKDGKFIKADLTITYRLRSRLVPDEEKKPILGRVHNGKAISLPKPSYPDLAKANHTTGVVEVSISIGEDGSIVAAGAISGHPDLIQTAVETACKARYSPTTVGGQPVKVMGTISYNFTP